MAAPAAEPAVNIHPVIERVSQDTLRQEVTVKPGMCGRNSLFVGQVGDWTWDAVSEVCGVNAFSARDAGGAPTYLSFYYYRLRGSLRAHPDAWGFGDRLEVLSRVFGFGSESVLTLHRIRPLADGVAPARVLDPDEFHRYSDPDTLYVHNFNRWISRSRPGNRDLVTASPVGFRHDHLPTLAAELSPRRAYGAARASGTFHDPADAAWQPVVDRFEVSYPVDITRDINGVGLLYFAAYFSIVDRGLHALWQALGRSDESFLLRTVLDQQVCYLGNADTDSLLRLTLRSWRSIAAPAEEIYNVVIEDEQSQRVIAISTSHIRSENSLDREG